MIADTSLLAWIELDQHYRNHNAGKILCVLRNNPQGYSDKEIQLLTDLPINIVTARRNDLIKAGMVYCSGKKRNKQNKLVKVWNTYNAHPQIPML